MIEVKNIFVWEVYICYKNFIGYKKKNVWGVLGNNFIIVC